MHCRTRYRFLLKLASTLLVCLCVFNNAILLADTTSQRQNLIGVRPYVADKDDQVEFLALCISKRIGEAIEMIKSSKAEVRLEDLFRWAESTEPLFEDCRFEVLPHECEIRIHLPRNLCIRYYAYDPKNPRQKDVIPYMDTTKKVRTVAIEGTHIKRQFYFEKLVLPAVESIPSKPATGGSKLLAMLESIDNTGMQAAETLLQNLDGPSLQAAEMLAQSTTDRAAIDRAKELSRVRNEEGQKKAEAVQAHNAAIVAMEKSAFNRIPDADFLRGILVRLTATIHRLSAVDKRDEIEMLTSHYKSLSDLFQSWPMDYFEIQKISAGSMQNLLAQRRTFDPKGILNDWIDDLVDAYVQFVTGEPSDLGAAFMGEFSNIDPTCDGGRAYEDRWGWAFATSINGGEDNIKALEAELKKVGNELFNPKADVTANRHWSAAYQEILVEAIFLATTYNDRDVQVKREILARASDPRNYKSPHVTELAQQLLRFPLERAQHSMRDHKILRLYSDARAKDDEENETTKVVLLDKKPLIASAFGISDLQPDGGGTGMPAEETILNSKGETFNEVWTRRKEKELKYSHDMVDPRTWPIESEEERKLASEYAQLSLDELEEKHRKLCEEGDAVPAEAFVDHKKNHYLLLAFIDELSEEEAAMAYYFLQPLRRIKTILSSLPDLREKGRLSPEREKSINEHLLQSIEFKVFIRELIKRWRRPDDGGLGIVGPSPSQQPSEPKGSKSANATDIAYTRFVQLLLPLIKTLAESSNPILIPVPIEAVQHMGESARGFLNTLQEFDNFYVELYQAQGAGETSEELHRKYNITRKHLPEGFVSTRENTLTLLPIEAGEEISLTEIKLVLSNLGLTPQDTIISPIGLQNDPMGILRGIVFGFNMLNIARNNPTAGEVDENFVQPYQALYESQGVEGFNLTAQDLIHIAIGDDNELIRALRKLIKLLPIVPLYVAEEAERVYENARKALKAL